MSLRTLSKSGDGEAAGCADWRAGAGRGSEVPGSGRAAFGGLGVSAGRAASAGDFAGLGSHSPGRASRISTAATITIRHGGRVTTIMAATIMCRLPGEAAARDGAGVAVRTGGTTIPISAGACVITVANAQLALLGLAPQASSAGKCDKCTFRRACGCDGLVPPLNRGILHDSPRTSICPPPAR